MYFLFLKMRLHCSNFVLNVMECTSPHYGQSQIAVHALDHSTVTSRSYGNSPPKVELGWKTSKFTPVDLLYPGQ